MPYKGKPLAFHQANAEKLRQAFAGRKVRLSVREIGTELGYSSTAAAMNEIHHLIAIGVLEYDELDHAYYLAD